VLIPQAEIHIRAHGDQRKARDDEDMDTSSPDVRAIGRQAHGIGSDGLAARLVG
jgi:hypothetical protein